MTYRVFPFVLAISLCLGVAGCSDQGDEENADNSAQSDTQSAGSENPPPLDQPSGGDVEISLVSIAPGGGKPVDQQSAAAKAAKGNPQAIEIGRQLFTSFNCNGCHFNGGGGMGPALMDDKWIYGSSMENIASSIREGRPNGMPSFRAMVEGDTVYKLAAYVKSLSENTKPRSDVKLAEPASISEKAAAKDDEGEIKSPEESGR
ncbi:Cbb3-type cytochrome c oxidase subunit CcoP2 [Methyloligella halotolerans]|uniref:Cbb3-type cytochrome c oxidase subunit CcoP2 n=1 Tax=Methyloligella halotolerans TaxID=1177755 RepID=A0A1E2RXE3_9HYPH|nr:c-type cytochrome [Methyloligella halotolerans]ODA66768.1 Cbb3-type cytochrome c oxidase subunit CcoP2 [Methyloligella halotolerans]